MDLDQLRLEVDGVTRTFAEWTRDFVDTYYPQLGQACYRVPALYFNRQTFGRAATTEGLEPNLVLNWEAAHAVGDLAHTIVLEKLEDLSHHLQASGRGPLFIISGVNYDNYLAKLSSTSRRKARHHPSCAKANPQPPCSKAEQQRFQPTPEPEAASHTEAQNAKPRSRSEPQHASSKSEVRPESRHSSKAEHQHTSDQRPLLRDDSESQDGHSKHQVQPVPLLKPQPTANKHHKSRSNTAPELSHSHSKLQKMQSGTTDVTKVEDKGKQLLPPRPFDRDGKRGEIDILLLHKKGGVVLIEVKAVGHRSNSDLQEKSEEELQSAVQRRVRRAEEQLRNGGDTLRYIMPDLDLPHVTLVLALPYVTRQQLLKAVSALSLDPNLRFLCKDDLGLSPSCSENARPSQTETGEDNGAGPPQDGGMPDLMRWWDDTAGVDVSSELPVDSMKTIVGRICGLMSVVSVWTTSRPRMEVRTPAQAIAESGRRLVDLVLLPRQAEILAQPSLPRLWLTGPMGSGKTLMLQLKGRQWLEEGRRVIVINVRISSRGRPQGHVLERSIRRDLERDCGTGSVERYDVALDDFHFESLHKKLVAGGPTENVCFVVDEVLWGMSIIPQMLVDHYPHSPIWCVASYVAPVPSTFQRVRFGSVLRSPPSIQLMLKEIDHIQKHESAYTTRSAARGLSCDGPPIMFIEHFKHDTGVRHLDCLQCANEVADIFQNKLGLKLHPPAAPAAPAASASQTDTSTTTLADHCCQLGPTKKLTQETAPLSFRDILILVVLPWSVFKHVAGYHWEASIPGALQYIMYMCTSNFIAGLRQRGVPLKLAMDNTLKEIGLPPEDEVIMSDIMGAHSLERKVVVLLRCGSSLTKEEVSKHISRYETVKAASGAQCPTEMTYIKELLTTPLKNQTTSKQLHFFVSLMHEVSAIIYPQSTIPSSPSQEDAEAIFHHLLGNVLVKGTRSFTSEQVRKKDQDQQTVPGSGRPAAPTVPRRGMEHRCDVCLDTALSHQEKPGASAAQFKAAPGEVVIEANSSFFVPDTQEDMEQRQDEVKRIRKALESLSEDDLDWEFLAASRCLSQYISITS